VGFVSRQKVGKRKKQPQGKLQKKNLKRALVDALNPFALKILLHQFRNKILISFPAPV
jgi:hypothetical protein